MGICLYADVDAAAHEPQWPVKRSKKLVLPLGLEKCMGWAGDGNTTAEEENWETAAQIKEWLLIHSLSLLNWNSWLSYDPIVIYIYFFFFCERKVVNSSFLDTFQIE